MFGKKQEKVPPPPPPSDVVFHVMPKGFEGTKATVAMPQTPPKVPPPPPVVPLQTQSMEAAPLQPASADAFVRPKKPFKLFWVLGGIVVLLLGTLGALLLLPSPQQEQQETPVATASEQPGEKVVEEVSAPTPTVPEATETPAEPLAEPAQPLPQEVVSSADTDQDGLTDVEETLYNTDPRVADKDSDGYLDGQEVLNLYNPAGTAPIRLADSSLATTYTNTAFGYSLLHPASWTVRALDAQNPREVLFTSATGEFVQVIVDDNSENLSALQWYAKQFPDVRTEAIERLYVDTLEGVWTKDKTTAYLTKIDARTGKRLLFGITYNFGEQTTVNFRTTFAMMVQSFRAQ